MIRNFKLLTGLLLCIVFVMTPGLAWSQCCPGDSIDTKCKDGLKIKADIRWRAEANGTDFNADTDMAFFSTMRTRLAFKYTQNNVLGKIELQYPHQMGWNSSVLGIDNTLDVHQAYLSISCPPCKGTKVKIGRTELKYGDQRLIGPVGWHNVGRTFDGIVLHTARDESWVDLFITKQAERSNTSPNPAIPGDGFQKDDIFLGLWGYCSRFNINAFYLYNRNVTQTITTTTGDWRTNLSRSTIGVNYTNFYDDLGVKTNFDFAYQMGTERDTIASKASEVDIAAWMFVLGVWYKLEAGPLAAVGAGIDMVSGDDDATDDKNNTFNNLYYTGHKWRGYMDYFVASNDEGLRDIFINLKLKCMLMEDAYWKFAFHNFATHAEYASAADPNKTATALGNEIDLILDKKIRDNLKCNLGLGYFMPSEDWQGKSPDNSLWAFVQLQAKFGGCK